MFRRASLLIATTLYGPAFTPNALASNIRRETLERLELLSNTDLQLKYARDAPVVDVGAELACSWFDDLNLPDSLPMAFAGTDLDAPVSFSSLFDLVTHELEGMSLPELHGHPSWLRVVAEAGRVLQQVKAGAV